MGSSWAPITSVVRAFGPSCFWYSASVPESRHISARPKGDGFWPRVWTEAIELLFYLVSSVNRSHRATTVAQAPPQWRRSHRGNVFVAVLVARAQQRLSVVVCESAKAATMFTDLVFWFAGFAIADLIFWFTGFVIADLVCTTTDGVVWMRESALCSEVQHQQRRRRDGGCRIVVAATEEGGGSDGGRERDERATRRWREMRHREGSRFCSPLRGCSGLRWSEVVGDFGGRGCSREKEREREREREERVAYSQRGEVEGFAKLKP